MKTPKPVYLRLLTLTLFSILTVNLSFANPGRSQRTPIGALFKQGLIAVSISGLGGYQEECVAFTLKNTSGQFVNGFIEPGRRLKSHNGGEQDIFIVKETAFVLAPGETKTINGIGFCCQSSNASPSERSGFDLGKMENENWLALSEMVNSGDYPSSAIQHAVWVLSDGHDIRSIPAYGDANTAQLRQGVADILGIEIPWYSILYAEDTSAIFSGIPSRFFAEIEFTVPHRVMLSGQIHD